MIFLLESFRDNEGKNRNDIVTSFEKEDYPNYTIFVHALKSTAKMIGANDLSEKGKTVGAGRQGRRY